MPTTSQAGIRRRVAILAAIIAAVVLVEALDFNRYFFSYQLLHLQPQSLSIHNGLLHDFQAEPEKLIALSDDPNVTFQHVDALVQRIDLSCKNTKPGASGRVYFVGDNGSISEANSIGYLAGLALYNRALDLQAGQRVTTLRFDLTNIKGDHVACADILLNPVPSFEVARIRLLLYACALLAAIAIMWRRGLHDMGLILARYLRQIAEVIAPREISKAEWGIIAILALVAAGTAYWRASSLDPVLYSFGTGDGFGPGYRLTDMWFNGDTWKIVTMASDEDTYLDSNTSEHPLSLLAVYPPVTVLMNALGLLAAVRIYWAIIAALWTAMLFIVLRAIGCRTVDAALFTVLAMTSAAFVFWFSAAEAFSIGSLTILIAFYLVSVAGRAKSPLVMCTVINLISLSMTLTNWLVGILAAVLILTWRRAFIAIVGAFLIATVLLGADKPEFPAQSFMLGSSGRLNQYLSLPSPARIVDVAPAIIFNTMVMPKITPYDRRPFQRVMTTEGSIPGSGSAAGYLGAAAWLALLCLGAWACVSLWPQSPVIRLLVLVTAAQFPLHTLFGTEPFLYSMHFLPLLILIAACVTRTRLRPIGLGLAILVAGTCLINNQLQFAYAAEFLRRMAQVAAGIQ